MTTTKGKPKVITICFYTTGLGLQRDCEILKSVLKDIDWDVHVLQQTQRAFPSWFYRLRQQYWDRLVPQWARRMLLFAALFLTRQCTTATADLHIFLERVHYPTLLRSKRAILIPNQEWFPEREAYLIPLLDAILTKTVHAQEIFRRYNPNAHYVGFDSLDRQMHLPEPDYNSYLHVAGRSRQKGTEALLRVWKRHPEWPLLRVICHRPTSTVISAPNIELISGPLSEPDLRHLQNSCGVHICPSETEGFGHYIMEAMSCAALVITTDAPPMNELVSPEVGFLVRYTHSIKQRLGFAYYVDEAHLEQVLGRIVDMPVHEKQILGNEARRRYLSGHALFQSQLEEALSALTSPLDEQRVGACYE